MNLEHASRGYKMVADTSPVDANFYGFTVTTEAVISSITAPASNSLYAEAYGGDESGIAGKTLPPGYYPIRGSGITLTSGEMIIWSE